MEQLNIQDNDEIEVDVSEIVHVLLNKIWVIILVGIIVGLVAIVGTYLFVTPQYESTTKMYVLSKQDSNTLTSQDMQTSLSLTKDYAELIKSRTVTEGVITQLNLNLTHEQLLGKMAVDSATDTRILSISVRDKDPYEAEKTGGSDLLDVVLLSATPDLYFTSLTCTQEHRHGGNYPLMNAGKAVIRGGVLVMPIAMTIHHGFIDGHHLSLFYKKGGRVS